MGTNSGTTVNVRVVRSESTVAMVKQDKSSTVALARALSLDYDDAHFLVRSAHARQVSTVEIPLDVLIKYAKDNLAQQGVQIEIEL